MDEFVTYIMTAIALVFVIEGLIYALFPAAVKSLMASVLNMENTKLQQIGLIFAMLGGLTVWVISTIS